MRAGCGAVAYRGGQYNSHVFSTRAPAGSVTEVQVPEKPPRQPLQPVMRPSRWDPWLGRRGPWGLRRWLK